MAGYDTKVEASDFDMSDAVSQLVETALDENDDGIDYSNLTDNVEIPKYSIVANLQKFSEQTWNDLISMDNGYAWVASVQMALHALGFGNYTGPINGFSGGKYFDAIKKFQIKWNRENPYNKIDRVDGVAGPITMQKMIDSLGGSSVVADEDQVSSGAKNFELTGGFGLRTKLTVNRYGVITLKSFFGVEITDPVKIISILGDYEAKNKLDGVFYKLDFSENNLTSLPPGIGKLTNLTKLNLGRNNLTELPSEIGNLTNLIGLYLWDNSLTSLPPAIGNLTNLTDLDLGNNSLTGLPSEIGNLTNLTYLNLGDNSLTELLPGIGNLTNLTKLNLGNNSLTGLPSEIGNLINLTDLYLGHNSLTELPPAIGKLTNLTDLNLGYNSLTELLPEIGNLTNLTYLNLGHNSLTELPSEIGKLTNLTYLNLGHNSLTELPKEIGDLTNLDFLNLLGNYSLTELSSEIGKLTNLTGSYLDPHLKK